MWVELSDARTLGVPLAWFPRLAAASAADCERVEIGHFGLHWEHLDEDISIAGLLDLRVTFHTGRVYVYRGVPPSLYGAFMQAESLGRFYNEHIRDCFAFTRVA